MPDTDSRSISSCNTLPEGWTHNYLQIERDVHTPIRMHYVEAKPINKIDVTNTKQSMTSVVLLHGFPTPWFSWRQVIGPLFEAGYHVLAPDMRGYGESSVPIATSAYTLEAIARDIVQLIEERTCENRAIIVGHDWGSAVAFVMCLRFAKHVRGLVSLCNPYLPPRLWAGNECDNTLQRDSTTYRTYFQTEGPADQELERDVKFTFKALMRLPSDSLMTLDRIEKATLMGGVFVNLPNDLKDTQMLNEEQMNEYVTAFQKTGFTGALNWYRNDVSNRKFGMDADTSHITCPTLMISGEVDALWPPHTALAMRQYVDASMTHHTIEGTGHWILQQSGKHVASLIVEWMATQ